MRSVAGRRIIAERGGVMSKLTDRLRNEFQNRDYRHAYADEYVNSHLATQIKVLREQRGWTQAQLAEKANMKQSRIALLENVNYSSWSLTTLKRLAEVFDVPLTVSFSTFGNLLVDVEQFTRESLERGAGMRRPPNDGGLDCPPIFGRN